MRGAEFCSGFSKLVSPKFTYKNLDSEGVSQETGGRKPLLAQELRSFLFPLRYRGFRRLDLALELELEHNIRDSLLRTAALPQWAL